MAIPLGDRPSFRRPASLIDGAPWNLSLLRGVLSTYADGASTREGLSFDLSVESHITLSGG